MSDGSGKSQESLTAQPPVPDSGTGVPDLPSGFSELDLALVDALQTSPRAPWSRIGRALGVDATTAARHWERLRTAGLAWITAHDAARTATVAFVEVRCRPGSLASVSAAAALLPWVFNVDETAGDFDLFLGVVAADLPALGRSVHETIGVLDGVRDLRTRLAISQYGEGSDWRTRALEPADRATLSDPRPPTRAVFATDMHDRPAPEDQALLDALGDDGRLGYTELAALTGMSEHTARRRLRRMLREGGITIRCDLARPLAGLPTAMIYRASVPHSRREETGNALARMKQVRWCVSASGPHNLLVITWLHGLAAVDPFEALLAERFPDLEVRDRTAVLRSVKHMDRLLDRRGRATGRVPFALPPA